MQSETQSQLSFLEAIIRSATDYAIISLDPNNRVATWSAGAEALLGWSTSEILGQSGAVIFTPEDRAQGAPQDEVAQALAVGRAEDERWHIRKDGSRFWASGILVPIAGPPSGFVKIMRDRTREREAGLALERSEALLRVIVENIPQLVWRSRRLGERTWGSRQWEIFTGLSLQQSVGFGWLDAIHPADRKLTMEAWHEAERSGDLYVQHRTRRFDDGEYRWFQTRGKRVSLTSGSEPEWIGTSTDVHDMHRALERQNVLVRELHHRTRNLLGIVTAIARQSWLRSRDPSNFVDTFISRITALARVQALVAREETGSIALRDLVEAEVQAHAGGANTRISIDGPPVALNEKAAETLALAIHELATNATKYGALSKSETALDITWAVPGGMLEFEWRETGLIGLQPPSARGYGRELIETALPFAMGAQTELQFKDDGIVCRIKLPQSEWIG